VKPLRTALAVAGSFFVAAQFARPPLPNPPVLANLAAPPPVEALLRRACYDCHSNETKLRWFDQIVPAYWLVAYDVRRARENLNFSELGKSPPAVQKAALFTAVNFVSLGEMPPGRYTALHPEARVTPDELEVLKRYLHPATDSFPGKPATTMEGQLPRAPADVPAAPNGLAFMPDYGDWRVVTTTVRFDNDTLRVVTGNPIAVQAIAEGHVHPWPDGTAFAKIAWIPSAEGRAALFKQVELMVKDARRYADSEGWGFGRWLGAALTPYGADSSFVTECTGCHAPMRDRDFVYSLPMKAPPADPKTFNTDAILPPGLALDPLALRLLASSADDTGSTMTTVYANGPALAHARSGEPGSYPAGSVLARVTWAQRDDPHWFGARIPDAARSVETLSVAAGAEGKAAYTYQQVTGGAGAAEPRPPPLEGAALQTRIEAFLSERPSPMP
jgi:Haem-binding domain/Cytochrome P460